MTDQREARVPERNVAAKRREFERKGLSDAEIEEELLRYSYHTETLRGGTQLNCWSIDKHESYALWRLYLSSSHSGVAIRSTVSKLRKAVEGGGDKYPDTVWMGTVRYADYIAEPLTRFSVILTKSPFYRFEQELRLFVLEYHTSEGGVSRPYDISEGRTVDVDLDILIDRIYLSPFAPRWFVPDFEQLIRTLRPKLAPRIVQSEIVEL